MGTSRPEISLVLPCSNESTTITQVARESIEILEVLGRPWELIVVDDHSSDDTAERVRQLASSEPRVRLIVHETTRHYSGACRTALAEARGRHVAIMDANGQLTARNLPRFLEALESGANLVLGWRRRRHDPLPRKVLSRIFNQLARHYLHFPLHDLNAGLCMFDRRFMAVAAIRHTFEMATPELYVCARKAGLRIAEVPVTHFAGGRASSTRPRDLWRGMRRVVAYLRSLRRDLDESPLQPSRAA